ncbi:MAG: response regulator [Acidobacteria bacterium]|nr:response regulator [Acidobacteriota bacterium]
MSGSAPRILLVDDTPLNLEALARVVQAEQAEVFMAEDGEAAWGVLDADPAFDLVLLDLMMPKLDGLGLLKRMKEDGRFKRVPVVLQTADVTPERIAEGIGAGAFYYLTKPLNLQILRGVVRAALEVRQEALQVEAEMKAGSLATPLLLRAEFRYQTPDDAHVLAALLAKAFPDPERVSMGVWELLINAIEHGNLEITYAEKTKLMQERRMLAEVKARLERPAFQARRASATLERDAGGLRLIVEDEGPGFDWTPYLELSPDRAFHTHGRGIAMAKAICFDEVRYEGRGNRVVAKVTL